MGVKSGIGSEVETKITEDEAALYDRQIRLWGLDSQKRLRSSKILMIGMGGLGAEVAKNIALAGVKSITLWDNKEVGTWECTSQFFTTASEAGKNRAEVSRSGINQLNPMVHVSSDCEDLKDKEEDFFSQYDVVCATDCSLDTLQHINNICRKHSVKFFCGDVWGFYGYCFSDLGHHEYEVEKTNYNTEATLTDEIEEPSPKKARVTKTIVEILKKSGDFVSLEKALTVKSGKTGTGLDKTTSPVFFLVHILLKFREVHGRFPSPDSCSKDIDELKKIRDDVMKYLGFESLKVGDAVLSSLFGELSPVCAIVGGVLAQEIIKTVSAKDAPIQNFFLFDGEESCGTVENIGR